MWKPSKKTLFLLISLTGLFSIISFTTVNWGLVLEKKNIYNELLLPVVFLVLSFNFIIPYVKKIKEEENKSKTSSPN